MQHSAVAGVDGRGVAPGLDPVAAGLEAVDRDVAVVEERGEEPDRVGAAADAGGDRVGQPAGKLEALGARLVADAAREVAHHARERVRAGSGAEEVGRVVDAGDPVAQRLVDGVLEGGAAGVDRDHLGAEQLHPGHVEGLALDVDGAHVDRAVEAEVRRGGGAGDAVLTKRMGKQRVIAETGAGQHGVASATPRRTSASTARSTWARRRQAPGPQRGPDAAARRQGDRGRLRQRHPQGRHQRGVRDGVPASTTRPTSSAPRPARTRSRAWCAISRAASATRPARRLRAHRPAARRDRGLCRRGLQRDRALHRVPRRPRRRDLRLRARRRQRRDRTPRRDHPRRGHRSAPRRGSSSCRTRTGRRSSPTRSRPASTIPGWVRSTPIWRSPDGPTTCPSPTVRPWTRLRCWRAPKASSPRSSPPTPFRCFDVARELGPEASSWSTSRQGRQGHGDGDRVVPPRRGEDRMTSPRPSRRPAPTAGPPWSATCPRASPTCWWHRRPQLMVDAGCDIIEIGLPYSDPVMDGPTIQAAAQQALDGGVRTTRRAADGRGRGRDRRADRGDDLLEPRRALRRRALRRRPGERGGAGLVTPDLTPDSAEDWIAAADAHDLDKVFLVASSSTDAGSR